MAKVDSWLIKADGNQEVLNPESQLPPSVYGTMTVTQRKWDEVRRKSAERKLNREEWEQIDQIKNRE